MSIKNQIKQYLEKQRRRFDAKVLPVLGVLSYMGYINEDICSFTEEKSDLDDHMIR